MGTTSIWPRLLQLCGYASRASTLLGPGRRQQVAAKRSRARFYEQVWKEAADEIGATFEALGSDLYEIRRNGRSVRCWQNWTPLDDPVTLRFAGNKPLLHKTLAARHLPVPRHAEFGSNSLPVARAFLERHRPAVVKPARGASAGQGITTGIQTQRQLTWAAIVAAGFSAELLIEEQVAGNNYRLLYLDGELLDAVRRGPPVVVGDGRSSVRRLVELSNRKRLDAGFELAQVAIRPDLEMRRTLARHGLTLGTVPAAGQRVLLKSVVNDNTAEENESVESIADAVVAAGREAAEASGVRLAGVDLVTPDITRDLCEVGGVVLEVNTTPGFYYHYFRQGERRAIAVPVLRACLERT